MQNSMAGAIARNWKRTATAAIVGLSSSFGSPATQDCFAVHNHGPIYQALDAVAGGIEKVIDVASGIGKKSSACDEPACDDGCDAMTLAEIESMEHYHSVPYVDAVPMPPSMPPAMSGDSPSPAPMLAPMESYQTTPTLAPELTPMPPGIVESEMPAPAAPMMKKPLPQPPQPISTPTTKSADDEWINSFSPEPIRGNNREQVAPPSRTVPKPPIMRNPAETIDSLSNPFLDDPQSRRAPQSLNQPASYWEPW